VSTHRDARARRGLLLVMSSAVAWGTVGVATQTLYGISATNPHSVGFLRLALALPALVAAGAATLGRRMLRVGPRDLALMALLGAMTALYQVCYFSAIRQVGVAAATVITLCSAPVIVAVLSSLLLQERLSARVLAALAGAIAGTALLVGGGSPGHLPGSMATGAALALASACGYAVVTLCNRSLAARCHPLQTVSIGFAIGAALLLAFALPRGLVVRYPLSGWALLAWLGLIPTALAYALFAAGMRTVGATAASIATLLEPLTSTTLAWLALGERLGPWGAVGALLLGGAMVGLLRARGDRGALSLKT
jgi:drug/metabolite transporter, DME family